jgi:preprotein translocase subunit SecG
MKVKTMYQVLLIIHVAISAALVMFVLLQQGKGGGMGGLGGGGASGTLFGSGGSADFMSRSTAILATGFFITSLTLSVLAVNQVKAQRLLDMPAAPVDASVNSEVPVNTK